MNPIQVQSYVLTWNPATHRGGIRLLLSTGSQQDVPWVSIEEFNAVINVLRESPVFFMPDGTLATGWEPVRDR
jgi:hypothetical protein